jgi:hypothetical protein
MLGQSTTPVVERSTNSVEPEHSNLSADPDGFSALTSPESHPFDQRDLTQARGRTMEEAVEMIAEKLSDDLLATVHARLAGLAERELSPEALQALRLPGRRDLQTLEMRELLKLRGRTAGTQALDELERQLLNAGVRPIPESLREQAAQGDQSAQEELARLTESNNASSARLSDERIKEMGIKIGEKSAQELLTKIGAQGLVASALGGFLHEINTSTVDGARSMLVGMGIPSDSAHELTVVLQRFLEDVDAQHAFDGGLLHKFENTLTRELSEKLLNEGLLEGFDTEIDSGLKRYENEYGLSRETTKRWKESLREGFVEGVERSVRKVVQDGIQDALDLFRNKGPRAAWNLVLSTTESTDFGVIRKKLAPEEEVRRKVSDDAEEEERRRQQGKWRTLLDEIADLQDARHRESTSQAAGFAADREQPTHKREGTKRSDY